VLYGLAAKLAAPDRPVVVLSGDGAMQMLGNAEPVTVAHRWRQWTNPRFVVCVLVNRDLAEVTWEQREMEGDPRFDDSQALPDFPYAGYADLLGLTGIWVEDPSVLGEVWERALAADRPVVLEVRTDPDVPLLPPFLPASRNWTPSAPAWSRRARPGRTPAPSSTPTPSRRHANPRSDATAARPPECRRTGWVGPGDG
jgi:pyruvate dehydrogenase (quinone)